MTDRALTAANPAHSVTRYRAEPAQRLYHGTTLDRAEAILEQGPNGREFYVTPSPRVAEHFACMKRPWFGTAREKSLAVLALAPKCQTLTVAEPLVCVTFNGGISAQYPGAEHYEKADLAWNPQYQYQFLTPQGCTKYQLTLPAENLKTPPCFPFGLLSNCMA